LKRALFLAFMITILASSVTVGTIRAQSTVDIILYAGPVSSGAADTYGFGKTANNITSPGPTLTLHDGDTVTVTLHNVGSTLSHSFAVTAAKSDSEMVLFDSEINPGTYVPPGSTGSVTFTVSDNVGDYYYICKVPGHVDFGMWGQCNIEAAIPEFPTVLLPIFLMLISTCFAILLWHTKSKSVKLR
jgi:uncharacterized cupredoxin-like copper-binding protein